MIKVMLWEMEYQYNEGYEPSKIMTLKQFQEFYNKGDHSDYNVIKFFVE